MESPIKIYRVKKTGYLLKVYPFNGKCNPRNDYKISMIITKDINESVIKIDDFKNMYGLKEEIKNQYPDKKIFPLYKQENGNKIRYSINCFLLGGYKGYNIKQVGFIISNIKDCKNVQWLIGNIELSYFNSTFLPLLITHELEELEQYENCFCIDATLYDENGEKEIASISGMNTESELFANFGYNEDDLIELLDNNKYV